MAQFPSWHAYSKMHPDVFAMVIDAVHDFVHTVGDDRKHLVGWPG